LIHALVIKITFLSTLVNWHKIIYLVYVFIKVADTWCGCQDWILLSQVDNSAERKKIRIIYSKGRQTIMTEMAPRMDWFVTETARRRWEEEGRLAMLWLTSGLRRRRREERDMRSIEHGRREKTERD